MKKFILLHFSFFTFLFSAAQPGALDLSFNPPLITHDLVRSIALQSDGKILVNEKYLNIPLVGISRITRLNVDGSVDTTFNRTKATNAIIRRLIVQPDDKILFAGDFGLYDSVLTNRIARLNSDGSLDTTFHSGTGFNDQVHALALQSDGKILCGGLFTSYNGMVCNRLVRLHSNGSYDSTFNTITGANGAVGALKIQPDGKILLGGDFTSYDGGWHWRIARANTDGSRDLNYEDTTGASRAISAIALRQDGSIYLGGNFTFFFLQPANRVVMLAPHGTIDINFSVDQGADNIVTDLEVINSKLLIAGGFSNYKNKPYSGLVMVNPLGAIDTSFKIGTGVNNPIYDVALQADNKIVIGGAFSAFNGILRNRIARLYNCLTPQPDSIYGNSYALCSGTPQIYSVTAVSGATKYEWTLPSGWTGSSDSISITATSNGSGGTISVKAFTDSCGYSYATVRNITTIQPPGVNICLVTVDTASTHNIVVWEKPQTALIDSFFIYRETSTNVYSKIAAVPYDSLSEYHDTAANPNTTSYRYRLSVLDTCGAESALSPYHNTIHLQNLGSGNFQWTFYQIENALNPVTSFNINRDALGNGNFFPIGNVPGTNATYFDNTFSSFPNAVYVIDVNWGIACNPSRAISTSRSNIKRLIDIPLSLLKMPQQSEALQVYPNPATKEIFVNYPANLQVLRLRLLNTLGQEVAVVGRESNRISVETLPKGIYTLVGETTTGRILKKVVVE